jgi:hypothetical protein
MAGSRAGRDSGDVSALHQASKTEPRWWVQGGASAGVVAGLVMTVWKMAEAWLTGAGAFRPPNLISTIVLGPSANTGAFAAIPFVVGMALHILASIGMGVLYAAGSARLRHLRPVTELVAINAYALLSWAAYQSLIMPWLAPTMDAHVSPLSLAVAHVVFAVAFAAYWIPTKTRRTSRI